MPERRGAGQAFQVGQDIIVTGQNNGLMMIIFESMIPGMLEYKETMSYHGSDGTWQGSGRVFFGKDSEYLDQDTWRQCSAVPLKDGLMITGPVRDNGTAEVTDTWRYRADSDTYEAYPVRFDTVRTRNSASCLLDGTMYVMTVSAAPGRDGEVRFASLDISDIAAPACPDAKKSEEHPDPRRKESGDDPRWSGKPRYTGTWDAPVDGGSWSRDGSGYWYYRTNAYFRDTWGYIVNPYADEKQNKADWFRFDRNGRMLTGWQFIDDKWYYLNPVSDGTLGACFIGPGRTPDGYEIDESGAWTGR